tara:strand:+ start:186 stop:410 length:225 start_codon:yes stop_codon:yes gene_type:complete
MAKDKKEKPILNFDDKEYVIEDLSEKSKNILNHINDIQNKINTNTFIREQLEVGRKSFVEMLRESLKEPEEEKS